MRKYINFLTVTLAISLLSGCLSSEPKPEKDKQEVSTPNNEPIPNKNSVEMPPESNLIDKIEAEVVIEDIPIKDTRQKIESVD